MGFLDQIRYDANGLVPAVVQDARDGQVLMVAYMNREALRRTLESGQTCFWSRSRQEYWVKGATSGNTQKVVRVAIDCDEDTVLVIVEQKGGACHTGKKSCFFREIDGRTGEVREWRGAWGTGGAGGGKESGTGTGTGTGTGQEASS